jgi:hypothetical protein
MSEHATHQHLAGAEPGDWLEVHRVGGGRPRLGQILEVLDPGAVPHFRVRWSEESETLHFPAEGDRLLKKDSVLGG